MEAQLARELNKKELGPTNKILGNADSSRQKR